jgi:subtilisin family serine protease
LRFAVPIGVIESDPDVDIGHPDLRGVVIGAQVGAPDTPPIKYDFRKASTTDHATTVAAIIAAHLSGLSQPQLVPNGTVKLIDARVADIGRFIGEARTAHNVRIFNVSADLGPGNEQQSFRDAVQNSRARSLFVVASGNNSKNSDVMCKNFKIYPACWANDQNVLVVTATDLDGAVLLPDANWSRTSVHLAAPGVGFYAPGRNRSYVPVLGTSFSTPLVTAAAALLFSSGLVTTPWEIKQRLIATADPLPGSSASIVGGRLNLQRALDPDVEMGVLTRNGDQARQLVRLSQDNHITLDLGNRLQKVELENLLRVHNLGAGRYRVVFVHPFPGDPDLDTIVAIEGTFPRADSDRFKAQDPTGQEIIVRLIEWDDFVGPVRR